MIEVHGSVAEGFESVRAAFEENFRTRGDVGAAFAATRGGRSVVDLWGGVADIADGRAWVHDTVTVVNSGTKGMASLCLMLLLDRGKFELDTALSEFWPGFGAGYEEQVTVRHVVAHTAGLHSLRDRVTFADLEDSEAMMRRVATEKPHWAPGAVLAYHGLTFGSLAAGIVRHVDGRSIGRFFAEEFASPLGIDAWIGFPADEGHRLAPLHGDSWYTLEPENPYPFNNLAVLGAEIPGATGVASPRAMARLYEVLALGGTVDGRRYLSEGTVAQAGVVLAEGVDEAIQKYWRRGFGLVVSLDPPGDPHVPAVGHPGAGGSEHAAWPELGVSYSYAMTKMKRFPAQDALEGRSIGGPVVMDPRAAALVDALYAAVAESPA